MKTNFKFTGSNMAAALLVLTYFFNWANASFLSMSGFTLTTTAISPGLLTYAFDGISRIMMIALAIIPINGALILFQNVTGDKRFQKYYRLAHLLPAVVLVVTLIGAYMKMSSQANAVNEQLGSFGQYMPKIQTPGLFDVLGFAVYMSLASSIYLLLVAIGKVKDKEYFGGSPAIVESTTNSNSN